MKAVRKESSNLDVEMDSSWEANEIGSGQAIQTSQPAMENDPELSFSILGQTSHLHAGLEDIDHQKTRLRRLRIKVPAMRIHLYKERVRLSEKRRAKTLADDALSQLIRREGHSFDFFRNSTLQKLIENWEAAEHECDTLERDCNLIVDQLAGQESRLAEMEKEYYNSRYPLATSDETLQYFPEVETSREQAYEAYQRRLASISKQMLQSINQSSDADLPSHKRSERYRLEMLIRMITSPWLNSFSSRCDTSKVRYYLGTSLMKKD